MFFQKTYTAVCGFAAVSSAHIVLSSPKPFAGTISSPLDASGSNFPCQMASHSGDAATMSLGSSQELAFIGSAVHGGGSCQVSITYDTNPTKDSVWKVIHSIEGGCPAQGAAGNLGNDATQPVPFTYNYTLPSDIPSGSATIGWTWLNRIGNREFYMNCAAVSLTGSGGSQSNYDALPDMVVANIPSISSCSTEGLEGSDYLYPNPGNSVEKHPFAANDLVALNGDCGASGSSGSSGSNGSSGSAPPASAAGSDSPSTTSSVAAGTGLPGAVFITRPNSAAASQPPAVSTPSVDAPSAAAPASTPSVSVENQAAAPPAATASSAGSSSGSSTGAQTAGSACSPEGLWNCVDGKSYQQCGSGVWTPVMPLAAGTTCTGGQGSNINIFAANGKTRRSMRFRS